MESIESTVSHRRGIALKETTFTISVLIYHRGGQRQNGIRETQTALISEEMVKEKNVGVLQGLLWKIASWPHICSCKNSQKNVILLYLHFYISRLCTTLNTSHLF